MSYFESVGIKSHVRSLAFSHPFLLAGIGSYVFVWRKNGSSDGPEKFKFIKSIQLMPQDIIGIKFEKKITMKMVDGVFWIEGVLEEEYGELKVIFYSIRFLHYCSIVFDSDDSNFKLVTHFKTIVVNMIHDLIFFGENALIINSRNEIIVQNLKQNSVQQKISGPQKCILYSAKFIENETNYAIIASGTVFKEVLIWCLELDPATQSIQAVKQLQTLQGHDGVIFDIDYYPVNNTIVTVSDDRSIRIWKGLEEFDDRTSAGWLNNSFRLVHIYYGHEARIWKVCLSRSDSICISVGEDSSMIAWSVAEPYRMITRKRFSNNNRIWSLELTREHIVCGGSDGSLQFIPVFLQNVYKDYCYFHKKISHQLKTLCFANTSPKTVLTCCIQGKFDSIKGGTTANPVMLDDKEDLLSNIFNDYIKLTWNENRTIMVIGSKHGHIGIFNVHQRRSIKLVFLEKMFDSKILDLNFVSDNQVIIGLIDGIVKIYDLMDNGTILREHSNTQAYILPESRHRWSSSGLLHKNLLIIGDSSGNVFAYYTDNPEPFLKLRDIHGHNGVTCIKRKPESCLIYSGGRNGKIMEYYFEECSTTSQVIKFIPLRTYAFFTDMEWIGGFQFDRHQLCFAYGFKSTKFLVWNMYQGVVEFEEECGGGHRSWDILFGPIAAKQEPVKIRFCYNNKKDVFCVSGETQYPRSCSALDYPSIPRKINCCCKLMEKETLNYFMVAGEDKSIQVLCYNKDDQEFRLVTTLWGHISNVASIKCLTKSDQSYAISVGGRSQLIIWKFWFSPTGELVCQEIGMNFLGTLDQIPKTNQQKDPEQELDVRYLDVDSIMFNCSDEQIELAIIVACSDAAYRWFRFSAKNANNNKILLLNKMNLGTSCLLQSKLLPTSIDLIKSDCLCAFTNNDGQLFIWSFDKLRELDDNQKISYKSLFMEKLHQNGINSLDWFYYKANLVFASGGDDNTVTIGLIHISTTDQDDQLSLNLIRTFKDQRVHTCQITGLKFYNHNLHDHQQQQQQPLTTFPNSLMSVSIDQQLICWDIGDRLFQTNNEKELDRTTTTTEPIKPIYRFGTSIADVSSMCLITANSVSSLWLICGEGFQLVRFNHHTPPPNIMETLD